MYAFKKLSQKNEQKSTSILKQSVQTYLSNYIY